MTFFLPIYNILNSVGSSKITLYLAYSLLWREGRDLHLQFIYPSVISHYPTKNISASFDRKNVLWKFTCNHDLFKHFELGGFFKTDEIHASFTAKVTPVKPIPVLEFMPRFTPRQEVMMAAQFSVRNACEKKAYAFWRIVLTHDDIR